jgi:serine/threonine protein kinase
MKVVLTVTDGPEKGRSMEFTEPRGFVIGRAKDADFRLPADDPYVGRRHVFLEICPPRIRLQDLGSTNVAHVNRKAIAEAELAHGDVIEIGYTQLQVAIRAEAAPRVHPCPECKKPIEILAGESPPERCPDCFEKRERAARRRERPRRTTEVRCKCGEDLTDRVNSDGRAAELEGAVLYCCEKHAPGRAGGRSVGPYEIRGDLGEGGMGSVHLVYHKPTARVLALKLVKDLKDKNLVKRFEREIRLQKALIHPNVVRYIDAGTDGGRTPYLVTEFIPGGSLDDYVGSHGGQLDRQQALQITRGVLQGLEFTHSQKIIHRDIKPPNVLLHKEQATGRGNGALLPKLADFGLAVCYAGAGGTRETKRNVAMGTLMFMPPEQIRDVRSVREVADVYAAGVMLYYLLTGHYTFEFPTPGQVMKLRMERRKASAKPEDLLRDLMAMRRIAHPFQVILAEQPIPIRKRDSSIPPKLASVIDRAVRKEAKERHQSAADFERALMEAAA